MKYWLIWRKIIIKMKIVFYSIIKMVTKKRMIIDGTGTILTPGNYRNACKGNGEHLNRIGKVIECCCDECDYMMCCLEGHSADECANCIDNVCPNVQNGKH